MDAKLNFAVGEKRRVLIAHRASRGHWEQR